MRIALGALLFSPHIDESEREELLISHNRCLRNLRRTDCKKSIPVPKELFKPLDTMRDDSLGATILGLTTKTVQEISLASEEFSHPFWISVLHSIIYAPLLYFHDIDEEVRCEKMVFVSKMHSNLEDVASILQEVKALLGKSRDADPFYSQRALQLAMAYRSFASFLPRRARLTLERIYTS